MKWYYNVFFAGIVACASGNVRAEPGTVVTLSSIGERVRRDNPDLKAARFIIDEAVGKLRQSGRLENPEFESELEHNTGFDYGRLEIGLSQKLPVTNRLSLEKDLGETQVLAAQAEVREVTNRLVGEASEALVRVLAIRERMKLLGEQAKISNELAEFISDVAKRGEASSLEAGQARLEASRFVTQNRQLAATEQQALGVLKPLLGIPLRKAVIVSGSLPSLRLPEGADEVERPALEIARLAVLSAEQQTEIERTKRYGDVRAGIYAAGENIGRSENEGIVGIRFSIPLAFWDKNEGNIGAAEAKAKRRRQEVTALNQGIRLEAEAARAEMLEWAKLARETEQTLLPQAVEQTELAEQAYRNGQGDLLTVLRSREQRLELAAAQLEALQNFQLALVRYRTALGNP